MKMASALLSPLLSSARKLLDLLSIPAWASCAPRGERSTFSIDLQRLERLLRRIQATLDDAGEREFQDNYVKLWIEELTELALDAEDVLDGYRYEMLRRHFQQLQLQGADASASASVASRKRNHDEEEDGSISERIRKITRRFQISSDRSALQLLPEEDAGSSEKIEKILSRFEEISRDRAALELGPDDGRRIAGRDCQWESRTTSHIFDESHVFGRTAEKERIIGSVLSCSQSIGTQVLPVVGMGGIGKTTMAQMVYKDSRVQEHFDLMGWIHVSEKFDLRRLTIALTESLTEKPCEYNELSSIHNLLKKTLRGKSVFLVLDDIWNQRQSSWQDFLVTLELAERVTIIVTTRSKQVARLVKTVEPLVLDSLPEQYCWLLFQHYAFGKSIIDEKSSLVYVGRKIMQKCGGLPLAVKSIGCLLRSKMDMQTWTEISESECWEDNEEIFSALRLSFNRLPGRLKPCFLLCALYPKGWVFTKDEMIHLWIADGYIHTTGCKTPEKVAAEYFDELNERSLIEKYFDDLDSCYGDQDLKKALARSPQVSIGETFSAHNIYELHIGSLVDTFRERRNMATLSSGFWLHDLIWDLARSLSSSRENNHGCILTTRNQVSQLFKLNYSGMLVLNDSTFHNIDICEFRYLRALVLYQCPDSEHIYATRYLKLLRYLHVSNYHSLDGENLNNLTESIVHLYNLEKLILSIYSQQFSMKQCHLFCLRYLQLSGAFNDWSQHPFCHFNNLDTLCLENCYRITELPICIGELTHLRRLQLVNISWIKKLNFYSFQCRSNSNICQLTKVKFPALEELEFDGLRNLEDWCGLQGSDCPMIQSITLRNCCKLRRIPSFGSVRNLIIRNLALTELQLTAYNEPSQLQTLDIRHCHILKSLKGLKNLCSLGSLYIAHCPQLVALCKEKLLFRPQHVFIDDCPGLKEWCDEQELYYQVPRMVKISDIKRAKKYGVGYFESSEHICLDICPEQGSELILSPDNWLSSELRLLKFGFESSGRISRSNQFFYTLGKLERPPFHPGLCTLDKLEIRGCPKLEALMDLQKLKLLRGLVIAECPLLYLLTEMEFPPLLESLTVEGCHKLLSLYLNISNPSSFTELEVSDCQGLVYIGCLGPLINLESLVLLHCPLLDLRELLPVIPGSVAVFLCPKLKKWCEIQCIEYLESLPDSP